MHIYSVYPEESKSRCVRNQSRNIYTLLQSEFTECDTHTQIELNLNYIYLKATL